MVAKGWFGTMVLAIGLANGDAVFVPWKLVGAVPTMTPKVKMVVFAIRNDSGEGVELMAGGKDIKLQADAMISLTMQAGEEITVVSATRRRKAGDVLFRVGKELDGTTVVVR